MLVSSPLSAIIEFAIESDRLPEALETSKEVSTRIDTVFSLRLVDRVYEDGSLPNVAVAREMGFWPRPNTKTNVGLGRPLK